MSKVGKPLKEVPQQPPAGKEPVRQHYSMALPKGKKK